MESPSSKQPQQHEQLQQQQLAGMLSPFIYSSPFQIKTREGSLGSGFTIGDHHNNISDIDDLEFQENQPLLHSSTNIPKSPADSIQLRRELFGELAEGNENVNFKNNVKTCCTRSTGIIGLCSSINQTFRTITTLRKPADQCLDGFRALAALWMLSYHVGRSFQEITPVQKWKQIGWLYQDLDAFHVALNGDMAVDIFLVLSGFLTCQSWLRQQGKQTKKTSLTTFCSTYMKYVFQRFIRLAPLLYLAIALSSIFEPSLTGNPDINPCNEWWPVHIFFVSNFYMNETGFYCARHLWYISMLMQLSMLTPFIFILCKYIMKRCGSSWRVKSIVPVFLILACTAIRGAAIRESFESSSGVQGGKNHMMKILEEETHVGYANPICRGAPYFSGMLVFLWNYKEIDPGSTTGTTRKRTVKTICCSCCTQIIMVGLLVTMCILGVGTHRTFGLRRSAWVEWVHANTDPEMHTLHAIFGRTIFGICISYWLLIVTCETSICGISTFLTWNGWAPIARLSYAAYVFTYLAIYMVVPSFIIDDSDVDPDGMRVRAIFISSYICCFIVSYLIALFFYCVVEMPVRESCRRRKK